MKNKKNRFIIVLVILSLFCLTSLIFVVDAVFFREKPPSPIIHHPRPERGQIMDCNGELLAIQVRKKNLTIWKPHISDIDYAAKALADIFDVDQTQLVKKINKGVNYQKLFSHIEPYQAEAVEKFLKENRPGGIYLEDTLDRFYPQGELASHIIGFTNIDNEGKSGIEQFMNSTLYPKSTHFHAGDGNNVFLTINQNIQFYTEQIARKAYKEQNADSVVFIAVDAKTGGILGSACQPTFNPNEMDSSTPKTRSNIASRYAYEPGSVFKIFSLGAALDSGAIKPDTLFFCDGKYEIQPKGDKKIIIKCLGHHGYQNFSQVIQNSCNAGTALALERMDSTLFYNKLKDFGFGNAIGLELPYENPGLIRSPNKWSIRTKPTIAIGQEILTTAFQLVSAATVYTNDGQLIQLRLIDHIQRPDGTLLHKNYRTPLRKVVSKNTAQLILNAMEQNTLNGTGKRSMIKGINISTKTGTAQMIDTKTRRYSTKAFFASCLAIFPTENPQIILYGGINYPKGKSNYGGVIVAPLIRDLAIETSYQINLHLPGKETTIYSPGTIRRAETKNIDLGSTMPNLMGFHKRDLLPLYKNKSRHIIILGNGVVTKQSPLPGKPLKTIDKIILELE